MKKLIVSLFVALIIAPSFATEGMWIPLLLKSLNESDMQSIGLRLSAEDIYSINHSSLKDAIVHFNGGCTAEVISNEGLILTNHHCGYSQIQAHSSEENNYLKDGFWAMSRDKELKNRNATATFIIRIEDVTKRVFLGIEGEVDSEAKALQVRENIALLEKQAVEGTHYAAKIKPFFYGNEYYMIVTETYKDVRLVGAPPSSIGKFGGDTDNWIWPRHTGDFSMFRIYADKDNNPAEISDDNVPYKPKKSLSIAMHDMTEGEFCMIYGFPGRTYQYLTSDGLGYVMNTGNPMKIKMRERSLSIIDVTMRSSEKKYIQYAAKQSRISNGYKKMIGQNIGLKENDALTLKKNFEAEFQKKASGGEYENLLAEFKVLYKRMNEYQLARDMFIELYYMGPEILRFSSGYTQFEDYEKMSNAEDFSKQKEAKFKSIKGFFKNYDRETDKKIFVALIEMYRTIMKDDFEAETLKLIDTKFKGDCQAYADYVYEKSAFCDVSKMNQFMRSYNKGYAKKMLKDPAYMLAKDLLQTFRSKIAGEHQILSSQIDGKMKFYLKARMEMFPDKKYAADANSTLRLTYGKIEGSSPKDGMHYDYYTTLDGMIQKNNLGKDDFELSPKMIELWKNKDYGQYAQDGELRVCFTGSNHTTGGNSGSPVLNGSGELIGLNFDRSWESTMSDYLFDTSRCRNIAVDIRYILWVVDKYAGAGHLVEEMNIIRETTPIVSPADEKKKSITKLSLKIEADPLNTINWFQRGLLYNELGQFENAKFDFEKIVSLESKNVAYLNAYAEALLKTGDFRTSLEISDQSLKYNGKMQLGLL
ncbi:MAG: S46 family peptidase [Flavobacteriales bacterium]|nr:S46 family peptidase [Flavobacteriales bacterium]